MHMVINIVLFGALGCVLGHLKIRYDSIWFWAILLIAVAVQINSFIQGTREK